MTAFTIREGDTSEVEQFSLYNEDNAGDTILVAETDDGAVVGFAQHDGAYIYFLESNERGAGRSLVDALKTEYGDWLQACNVGQKCAGFWVKMGFERDGQTGERPGEFHYEWYGDD